MIMSDPKRSKLIFNPVGNQLVSRTDDVLNVKNALSMLGFFHEDEPHGIITRELDSSIKNFQREKGLKIDGLMYPGGETETALSQAILSKRKGTGGRSPDIIPQERSPHDILQGFSFNLGKITERLGGYLQGEQEKEQEADRGFFRDYIRDLGERGYGPYQLSASSVKSAVQTQKSAAPAPAKKPEPYGPPAPAEREEPFGPPVLEKKIGARIPQYEDDELFDKLRENLKIHEGGIANRSKKSDPGGLTNQGLSQVTLDNLKRQNPQWNLPNKPTELTNQEITSVFRHEYYERPKIKLLSEVPGLKETQEKLINHVFDAGITSGTNDAGKWLQESLDKKLGTDLRSTNSKGQKFYDGNIGPSTRKAVQQAVRDGKIRDVHVEFIKKRIEYMRKLENYEDNKGWEKRVQSFLE